MPHDPSHEKETTPEQLFKRLMETSEEDLPPVPAVAAPVQAGGVPGQPSSEQTEAVSSGAREGRGEPMERLLVLTEQIVANQQEFMAEFRALQDIIEEALGGG